MKYNNSPIGIFDSGLGGLTVFKEVRKILPDEDLIYFGDTARVPYGNKSKETVLRYSTEISKFLISKGVKIVVAACNTSSSLALDDLRKGETIPIFGVIEPGAKKAVEVSSGGNIAVIGTSATIKSRAYSRVIYEEINALKRSGEYKFKSNFKVIEKACPLFVPLVEEGFLNEEITKKVINYYLNPVIDENLSCLVFGCTHYPILKDLILEVIGRDIQIIDSGIETAKIVKYFLKENDMLKDEAKNGSELFFVSDDLEKFKELGEKFLGRKIENVSIVNQFL
ncbi:MAG: glutamate racemase [Candidatus Acidulodesulfobacterium ferriphilum]|uniref:Glutamate racemase n=1 Tax=Candidatus Acidulodesulfobacterium ferriphilum TaxID=2597223 RepID=A0A519B9G9_9DELT|nr:MAG: glutamate racemase [Candidatus Acidulodesulfobacterium ferriphilum]